MENYKELVEIMLPEGILKSFEVKDLSKTPHSYTITLEEKNRSPKLPSEYTIGGKLLTKKMRLLQKQKNLE